MFSNTIQDAVVDSSTQNFLLRLPDDIMLIVLQFSKEEIIKTTREFQSNPTVHNGFQHNDCRQ